MSASAGGAGAAAAHGPLSCNRCWKAVDDVAFVSSCSHFFCRDCARKSFSGPAASLVCPVCDSNLSERANGFVREVNQKTSNKTIQLCGLTPDQILKIASRAIDFFMYQVDLIHERERGTGKNRHHELALECDRYKERIVQYENDVNTLTHQVQRLQEVNEKARAELEESVQKYEEKSRQKRKLYEMYTALKQKAENQGLLYSPAPPSQQTQVRYQAPSPPPPPPPPTTTTPLLGTSVRYAAPSGASASFEDGGAHHSHSAFNSPSLRAASQVASSFGARSNKSPRLTLDHSSVHHLDKFSALRSDFAKRTRSPLSISAIATMPVSQQQQQQQQQQQSQHVQQPPPQPVQSSRMPLADLSNVTFRAPSTTNDAVGNNMRSASSAALPELSSFVSMSYSTTPLQSFAARLRRPQTPSRVRRSMAPFNS